MTARPTAMDAHSVDPTILGDIKRASTGANVDFAFMVAEAAQESGFQPDAKAATTNATGLYQFIDTTWLSAVKQWGGKYGLGQYAAQITVDNGRVSVADPAMRQQILDLRKAPAASASLAAELARSNKVEVERGLGRPAGPTDLYLAHFLGAQGATSFIRQIESDGAAKAADLLPQAAAANRSVFYDDGGQAKSVAQIYRNFSDRLERQADQYAGANSLSRDAAAEALALDPMDTPKTNSQPLLATMNILTMAALKLLGKHRQDEQAQQSASADRRRPADTTA